MLRTWVRLTLLTGLSWPALGLAQTPAAEAQAPALETAGACSSPGSEDTEAARQAFRDGQIAFSEGDYARAAELWRGAYERDCTAHALLLNLAIAEEMLGRPDQAIQTLLLFDERVPDSPYVAANQRRISRLQRAPTTAIRPRREAPKACPPAPPPRTEERRGGSPIPLAVALGGGVVALLGGAFYAQARSAASSAADGCGGQPGRCATVDRVVDGERARARAETAGWIGGAGLAILAGGLVWQFASPSERVAPETSPKQTLRLSSRLSTGRLGISLSGDF
jgi:tetratricopeptide (TPR) repeat protein